MKNEQTIFISHSPEETEKFGGAIGEKILKDIAARGGRCVATAALYGGLGAGKTCWTRGFARAFSVVQPVTSPTYTIINAAESGTARCRFYHIDAYRLNSPDDFINIGGEEILEDGICAIEWAERIESILPAAAIKIKFTVLQDGNREIIVEAAEN